ncbi:phosphatidylinositol-specific phospholipase C1-like protein [Muricauda sp. MAR_2010_75]|uniref:phosphatidylinositol-specific phospholipase C1-like protein n=1 Tax=Allomuricauda sp. MAR_2010_75 TaxID=1250232 RepID=UPI00055CFD4B|nr:phosphatidylinositol-specific phospholipase C1-like protein [Muricauda sp. MAR_2010_75]
MKTIPALLFLVMLTFFFKRLSDDVSATDEVKLNDIQVIGSHNSYKIGIDKPLFEYLLEQYPALTSLEYEHIPLSEQLDLGLRSLELDVYADPEGGYFSNPKGLEVVREKGAKPKPFDEMQKLQEPGLKVFHIQEIDFRSHQLLFKDALVELKRWSEANQGHTPIIITLNAKDSEIKDTRKPFPFTGETLRSIDVEIREIFEENDLVTPDMIRGNHGTLEEAILIDGWPVLSNVKNCFLFVLDEGEEKTNRYLEQFPLLKGAVLFVNEKEGNPNAAFRVINDPVKNFDKIKDLVSKGYMIRTRADADTKEARENDYTRFEKAKASGAQVITTDYYLPSTFFESDFKIGFEGGVYERGRNQE